jgi:hypothetical protein
MRRASPTWVFLHPGAKPLGHGPGNEVMPELTAQQSDRAIETCAACIKTLQNSIRAMHSLDRTVADLNKP